MTDAATTDTAFDAATASAAYRSALQVIGAVEPRVAEAIGEPYLDLVREATRPQILFDPAEKVRIVGASLGGGAAAQASIDGPPGAIDRVVLIAHMTIDAPERLRVPALFILARDDANASGPRLPGIRAQYEQAQGPKELVVLDGDAHAQFLFATPQGDRLLREIVRFVSADRR